MPKLRIVAMSASRSAADGTEDIQPLPEVVLAD
jgi:hypothetical protein